MESGNLYSLHKQRSEVRGASQIRNWLNAGCVGCRLQLRRNFAGQQSLEGLGSRLQGHATSAVRRLP